MFLVSTSYCDAKKLFINRIENLSSLMEVAQMLNKQCDCKCIKE